MRFLLYEDIEAVMTRFPSIDEKTFLTLIELDPTYAPGKNSVGTYGKWILNLYDKGQLDPRKFGEVEELLIEFEEKKRYIQNKDINQYKTLDELAKVVDDTEIRNNPRQQQRANTKAAHKVNLSTDPCAEHFYEDELIDVWIPHSYAVAKNLGSGSNWCTAVNDSDCSYRFYKDKFGGDYFIILDKLNPGVKYLMHVESNLLMDINNHNVYMQDLSNFFALTKYNKIPTKESEIQLRLSKNCIDKIYERVEENKINFLNFKNSEKYKLCEKSFVILLHNDGYILLREDYLPSSSDIPKLTTFEAGNIYDLVMYILIDAEGEEDKYYPGSTFSTYTEAGNYYEEYVKLVLNPRMIEKALEERLQKDTVDVTLEVLNSDVNIKEFSEYRYSDYDNELWKSK